MLRFVMKTFDDIKALTDFIRGQLVARGTMTSGTGVALIEDDARPTTESFTALGVTAGYMVYDKTEGECAAIEDVTDTTLTVPNGSWAEGNEYEVRGPAISHDDIDSYRQSSEGQWYLGYYKDDGFELIEP